METLLGDGKVRAIGVSNFMVEYLRCSRRATVVPTSQSDRGPPLLPARQVQAFGAERGIVTQAWSPIGGITFTATPNPQPIASQNPGKALRCLVPGGYLVADHLPQMVGRNYLLLVDPAPGRQHLGEAVEVAVETSSPWHTSKGAGPA